ncbi:trypco2 family protein [Microbacterium sp. E-13]|uniref:trypco2 family protein n=1 Tax=Microbacterium sp. E-13 TaxID=3404048 RepID=UPI003CE7EB65
MDADGLAVPLSDAIENVRAELEDAIRRGAGSDVAFEAGPVEMEFEVAFSAEGGGGASFKVWVVDVSARGDVSRTSTNRLKVTLQPVDRATGEKALIGALGNR